MAKKRTRYVVTERMEANGVSLKGVVVMDMGECNVFGHQPRSGKNPVRIAPEQLTYRLFKFVDMKEAKSLGIPPALASLSINKNMVGKLLKLQDKDDK